ncbi:hypothetical protein Tco_1443456, partial [Tanacetum coccineum]
VLDLEKAKNAQAKEIADLKKRVQKLERKKKSRTTGLERLRKVGMSTRVESSKDKESLVDDTHWRSDNEEMFDINDLHGDEVNVDMPIGENQEQSTKEREVITSVEDSATPTTIEEITLAQTLIQIKAAKPKVVTTAATTTTTTRPKARGIVVQKPKEEKLVRKQEEEANLALIKSWDNTQAMMEADFGLAQRLQTEEQGEITIKERSRLFVELMNKRKKHFAMLKAEEKIKSKKETKESYKGIEDELEADKSKKAESRKEQQQESSKRQRIKDDKETGEHEEVEVDDEAGLKKHLVIVKDDKIATDAIPLATKPPDGSSKRYSLMIKMLRDIDSEDLETLWKLVKTKHGDIRPEVEHERVLWGDLKVMFEPDIRSEVWRNLQGYTVTVWKLYDLCGVHFLRFGNVHIFMLVKKRYPLTPITITNMLNKKLQTDYFNEICYQLLKLMVKQQKGQ